MLRSSPSPQVHANIRILFSLLSMTTIMIDTWGPMLFQNLMFPDDNVAWLKQCSVCRSYPLCVNMSSLDVSVHQHMARRGLPGFASSPPHDLQCGRLLWAGRALRTAERYPASTSCVRTQSVALRLSQSLWLTSLADGEALL